MVLVLGGLFLIGCGDDGAGTGEDVDLASCLREAGAKVTKSGKDLSFAKGKTFGSGVEAEISSQLPDGTSAFSTKSTEGRGGWHIYYGISPGKEDPGFSTLIDNPRTVGVVAYIHPDDNKVVAKADECLEAG